MSLRRLRLLDACCKQKRYGLGERKTASRAYQLGKRSILHWRIKLLQGRGLIPVLLRHQSWSYQTTLKQLEPEMTPCFPMTPARHYSPAMLVLVEENHPLLLPFSLPAGEPHQPRLAGFSVTALISSLLNCRDLFLDVFPTPFIQSPASVHGSQII